MHHPRAHRKERSTGILACGARRDTGKNACAPLKSRGFTLIEMLTVLMIIGILSAVVITGYKTVRENARRTKATQTAKQLWEAWNLYLEVNGSFPKSAVDTISKEQGWYVTDKTFARFVRATRGFHYDISRKEEDDGLKDPWGNHFRFQLDPIWDDLSGGTLGKLRHPDGNDVKTHVIVWSRGTDGKWGTWPDKDNAEEAGKKPPDDLVVW